MSEVPVGVLIDMDVYCPQCLYNVRGVTGERCPECGLLIDREDWAASPIPWEHRRNIGSVRGYIQTVRLVTSRTRRMVMATPQGLSVRDAWRFWLITVLPPAGLVAFGVLRLGSPLAITDPVVQTLSSGTRGPLPWVDLFGPWEAGMLLAGVWPSAVLAIMMWLTLGMALVCRWSASVAERDRAWAMALYASAPLAYWTITLLCGWALLAVAQSTWVVLPFFTILLSMLIVVPLIWWVWRMAWTALVVGKCSFPKAVLIAVGGLTMLIGFGVVMPWVIGLVRMMVVA